MIPVSNDFKNAMKQPIKQLQAYITGTNINVRSNDDLMQFKVSCETSLCKTAMRKLEAKIIGTHNVLGQWVHVGFGVKLPDGSYEYIDYGSFLVTEITTVKDTGITTIIGYDRMIKSMTKYNKLEIEYPINLLDYTKILCNACGLEILNEVFGVNICPTDIEYWESGGYDINDGRKIVYNKRIRLKNLIRVIPNTQYYALINRYRFVIREYDENGEFIRSIGSVSNGSTFTTSQNAGYIGIGMYDGTNFQDFVDNWDLIKPFICLNNEIDKTYKPYNTMNDWQITQELWENIDGITYRDILQEIAQVTCTTVIITNDDKIYFKPITATNEELTYDNMMKLKLEPIYGEINSVVLSRTPAEDNIYMRDEESIAENGLTEWKIENNEIIDKDRENAMTPIYNAMHGISYYPFETTTEGLGWYEIGDNVDIINDLDETFNTTLFNFSILIDGGIKEILKTIAETKTKTQYQYATGIEKRVKNTEIIVNKQEQYIEELVTDMYNQDGIVHENFTRVYQDINNIINSVQNTGGNNLIKNSVMFAFDNEGNPNDWEITGNGTLVISASADSMASGGLSGHVFVLNNKTAKQTVRVKPDNESDADKIYYSFSTRIKKNATGSCYVKLYNTQEEHIISIPAGESSYYKEYSITGLLPKENYYIVEFYGSADSDATFTDNMLALGEYRSQWQQASGEVMNTQVNINLDGVLVKSSVYLGDYTVMSPLEFAGYSNINGILTKVFSLNKDTTEVEKLKARKSISMSPIKIVPVTTGNLQGWAFVPSTE